jgi:hypothetical protein
VDADLQSSVASCGGASELRHARQWRLRQRYYAQGRIAVIEFAPESAELLRDPAQPAGRR